MKVRILAVTDEVDQRIYNPTVRDRMEDVDLVLGCGDLPASYLEFLSDALMRPVYYVLGNHANELTRVENEDKPRHPDGCIDLGGKVVRDPATGLILAGLPGSIRYADHEPVQFTERQIQWMMLKMAPKLLWNRFRHGRALDILVSHSPPRHVGDREDAAHRGFVTMRTFLQWFTPPWQLHGHVHLYDRSKPNTTRFLDTMVVNVYPYRRLELEFGHVTSDDPEHTAEPASDRPAAEAKHLS